MHPHRLRLAVLFGAIAFVSLGDLNASDGPARLLTTCSFDPYSLPKRDRPPVLSTTVSSFRVVVAASGRAERATLISVTVQRNALPEFEVGASRVYRYTPASPEWKSTFEKRGYLLQLRACLLSATYQPALRAGQAVPSDLVVPITVRAR